MICVYFLNMSQNVFAFMYVQLFTVSDIKVYLLQRETLTYLTVTNVITTDLRMRRNVTQILFNARKNVSSSTTLSNYLSVRIILAACVLYSTFNLIMIKCHSPWQPWRLGSTIQALQLIKQFIKVY